MNFMKKFFSKSTYNNIIHFINPIFSLDLILLLKKITDYNVESYSFYFFLIVKNFRTLNFTIEMDFFAKKLFNDNK